MRRVELHPDAVAEAGAAHGWYAAQSPAAASAFFAELDWAIEAIREAAKATSYLCWP